MSGERTLVTVVVADDPRMLALWDSDANAGVDACAAAARSSRRRWWRCLAADDCWCAAPAAITRSRQRLTGARAAGRRW